jgi:hypothetical protein
MEQRTAMTRHTSPVAFFPNVNIEDMPCLGGRRLLDLESLAPLGNRKHRRLRRPRFIFNADLPELTSPTSFRATIWDGPPKSGFGMDEGGNPSRDTAYQSGTVQCHAH